METSTYKVSYQGLRKKESYDEIVDYLENKQEKIKYPNRLATQIRNSPQLSNLLDGDGMGDVEMEKQQMNQIKHEQAEHAVQQIASSSGGTAQILRVAASQTDKPLLSVSGTQYDKPVMTSLGTQSDGPHTQIFDMSMDEKAEDLANKIESESVKQSKVKTSKIRNIPTLIAGHLGERILSPSVQGLVSLIERGLGRGLPSSSNQEMRIEPLAPPIFSLTPFEPPVFALTPFEPVLPPKNPVGRPRKIRNPIEDNEPGPMAIEPQKRKKEPNSPGKEKTKAKKKEEREQEINSKYLTAIKNEESDPTQPKASTGGSSNDAPKTTGKPPKPASSTGGSSTANPKNTVVKNQTIKGRNTTAITKQTASQLAPSVIGIQRLVEAFKEAKNTNVLSPTDISAYMILYDDYKGSAGKKAVKQEKLDELRALYKRVLYKK
jgi:hypothetical protein